MNPGRFRRNIPLRIEILMKYIPRRHQINQFDTANFNNPVALGRVQTSGFGIKYNLSHGISE